MTKLNAWLRSYPRAAVAAFAVALFGTACDQGPTSPSVGAPPVAAVTPTPAPTPTPTPTPPPTASKAVLTFATLTARSVPMPASPGRQQYWYVLRLILAETGGKSGASIVTPVVVMPNGDRDLGCSYEVSRIEPGGTWDMDTLGYCAPEPSGFSETATLTVIVNFTDDEGHPGSLTSRVEVTR